MRSLKPFFQSSAIALVVLCSASAQTAKVTLDHIKFHGASLEDNLSADSATRDVVVALPPSYQSSPAKHYPVVYMLHGYTDSTAKWFSPTEGWTHLEGVLNRASSHVEAEMIIVVPDAYTKFAGSMYSNSVTTGDWETFIAEDLVAYIDSHYRTIPRRDSRGLSGHSMGGYGTIRIGMKRPDVFSSIYMLSPCCMSPRNGRPTEGPSPAEQIRTMDDFNAAPFGLKAAFASAAAWAPNPKNPPFYFDLPTKNGEVQPDVVAKFHANAPLSMVDSHIPNLKKLKAIAFDTGDRDRGIAATIRVLDQMLNDYGIEHFFEIYDGDHISGVPGRIENQVLPFFAKNLSFEH
ncbi:MAG: alpha/beta hydrolase-fold protein [Acidobacteria bacterium]|nr:alpha/beta hydrolase-fold protein [Acidobacteriota bacterium]MDA1234807.1 alpha/beta hydrolase-fold protein [Acidobacteriota bacterium]